MRAMTVSLTPDPFPAYAGEGRFVSRSRDFHGKSRTTTLRNTMRKIVIAGNWKMNKTVAESVKLAADVVAAAKDIKNCLLYTSRCV